MEKKPIEIIFAGDNLKVINDGILPGCEIGPKLKNGEDHIAQQVYYCKCGQEHIDIGLLSNLNYVSCYKCEEHLPQGHSIHWCNSIRFEKIHPPEEAETKS